MIPSVLAQHVEQGIKDFLRTTFPVTTPFFSHIADQLLNDPGNVFKGPYLGIQLPFQQEKEPAMLMGKDRLISDRNTMRLSPRTG